MKALRKICLFLLLSSSLSGCATIYVRTNETKFDDSIYPATQQDAEWVDDSEIPIVGRTLMLPDFIPSVVFDTILLPVDYFF